uniref:interleukin-21 receptor n=1 Tax=Semicossyphus pulcher TaxID=241346 RepID=UPI0037E74849
MLGPGEGTVWSAPSRLKTMLLIVPIFMPLLVSTGIVCPPGNNTAPGHKLQCVSDYVSIINCSLSDVAPSDSSSSSWLTFVQTFEKTKFECMLINTGGDYFCSVDTSSPMTEYDYGLNNFVEDDTFQISLSHNQNDGAEICELLTKNFRPFLNIKPNTPCCLTRTNESGQHHFTWKSTYEPYSQFDPMADYLMYELHYYKRGDKLSIISHTINTAKVNFSINDDVFVRDTDYSARVRSSPNQAYYKGTWSDWSSEVYWRTKSAVTAPTLNTVLPHLGKVFIPLCVMGLLVLLLCYAPIKKWRQGSFIPTPAPYFHTLYHDCQGDFKSWVVTKENMADMLKAEETLQIDKLTKCADIQEEEEEEQEECQHQFLEGSTYSNITDPGCDASLLGIPYAVSSMAPLSDPGSSLKSLTFSSQPGSPTEGDSGCWLSSHTSLERDPPWYCNEYCTLSAFQQISPVTAMKCCTTREEQTEGLY